MKYFSQQNTCEFYNFVGNNYSPTN